MINRIFLALVIALTATSAMADPPAGKGKGKGKGPNPPGHAYGLREKQDEGYSKELEKLVTERDRELVKINDERDRELRKAEQERDRELRKAENDEEREAVIARYEEKQNDILERYDEKRAKILANYHEKRERILAKSDDDDDDDDGDDGDDDDDDGDDDDDDDDDDGDDDDDDDDDRGPKPVVGKPVDRSDDKVGDKGTGDVGTGERSPRDVRGDIAELDEEILEGKAAHAKRLESLKNARKRAKELGNEQQVETVDRLIKRERDRFAGRMETLEKRRAALEAELDIRRKEEKEKDPGGDKSPKVDDADAKKKQAERERTQRQRVKEIETRIKTQETEHAERVAELELKIRQATAGQNAPAYNAAKKELDELNAQHERRMARLKERLNAAEAAWAGSVGSDDPKSDNPRQAARDEVLRLRRALAEAEEDVDAEKRRHQRRSDKIRSRLKTGGQAAIGSVEADLGEERERHQAELARLENQRARIADKLKAARARQASLTPDAPKLESQAEIEALIKQLEKQLDAAKAEK